VGRWMMWSGIPTELYCFVMEERVSLIWGLGPFGIELVLLVVDFIMENSSA